MVTPPSISSREVQAHLALYRILLALASVDGRRSEEEVSRLAVRRQFLDLAGVPDDVRTPVSEADPLTAQQRAALEQECHQMGEILLSFAGADGMAARERTLMRGLAAGVGALFSERVSDLLAAQGAAQRGVRSAARVDRKHGLSLRFLRWTSLGLMVMVVALGVTALFLRAELSAARAQITEVTSATERWGAIVERSQRSVVLIQTVCRGEPQWGTGFFVSEDRVATNRHVIAPCCGTFPTATALRELPACRHEYAVWRAGDPLHLRRSDSGGLLASRRGSPRLDEGTAHWSTAAGNLRPGAIDTPESDSEVDQFLSDVAILEVDLSPGSTPPAPLPIRRADAPVSILSEALILGYHDAWLPSQLSSTPTVLPRPTIGRVSSADHASLVIDATFLAGASGAPVLSSDGEVLAIATMSPKRDNSTSHAIRPMRLARLVVGSLK